MLWSLSTLMVHLLSQQIPLAVDVSVIEPNCQETSWNFLSFCFFGSRIFSQAPLASGYCSSVEWWILNRPACSVSTWLALCCPACSAVIQLPTACTLKVLSSTRQVLQEEKQWFGAKAARSLYSSLFPCEFGHSFISPLQYFMSLFSLVPYLPCALQCSLSLASSLCYRGEGTV